MFHPSHSWGGGWGRRFSVVRELGKGRCNLNHDNPLVTPPQDCQALSILRISSLSTLDPRDGKKPDGNRAALTWAGPGSAVWLGQATAKVPSAEVGSPEGRMPA